MEKLMKKENDGFQAASLSGKSFYNAKRWIIYVILEEKF